MDNQTLRELKRIVRPYILEAAQPREVDLNYPIDDKTHLLTKKLIQLITADQEKAVREARLDEWQRIAKHTSTPSIVNEGNPLQGWYRVKWEYARDRLAELTPTPEPCGICGDGGHTAWDCRNQRATLEPKREDK